jgi:UDP-N-acetylmuramate--alanine ligase
LDYWQTVDRLIIGFKQFIDAVGSAEHFFWHGDNLWLSKITDKGYSYGFDKKNALFIESYRQEQWRNVSTLCFAGRRYEEIQTSIIGLHNVLNAAAVFGLCIKLGIHEENIRAAFMSFKGIDRRLQYKGEFRGVTFYDDYAHHPTEISTTLSAIKKAVGHRRVILAFQPHRYSRTLACLGEFGDAVNFADLVVITDIYAAGEAPIIEVNEERLLSEIQKKVKCPIYYFSRDQLVGALLQLLQTDDCLITMGAGDISQVSCDIMENFR